MTSECDVGTSSTPDLPGGLCQARGAGLDIEPGPVGGGHGETLGQGPVESFSVITAVSHSQSALPRCCDSCCWLRGDIEWHGEGSTGLEESWDHVCGFCSASGLSG